MDLICKRECYDIIGAAMEVYRDKGHGFAEPVYQECMEIELAHRDIRFHAQREVRLIYRGQTLNQSYIPDLICH